VFTVKYSGDTAINGTMSAANFSGPGTSLTGTAGSLNIGGTAAYSTNWWSTSHYGTYYLVNNWDGTYWHLTSNHPNGVRVAYADNAGSASTAGTASNANALGGVGSSGYALLTGATFTGDITTYRAGSPSTGVLYLGNNSGTRYLYYDGSQYILNGAGLSVGGTVSANTSGTHTGAVIGNASSATLAAKASTLAAGGGDGSPMTFTWADPGGQPTYVWGSSDGATHRPYTLSNFSVNYANSAGSAGSAGSATLASKSSTLSQNGGNGAAMTFNWSGQGGQPTYLWGSNDGVNHYVWNPSNFSVSYAATAGSATTAGSASNSSNTNSISNAVGGAYTWTGTQNFLSSNAVSLNGQAGTLVAFGNSGGTNAAVMSFHRPGAYAINMGLDTDNVFRLGGWSDGAIRIAISAAGTLTATGDVVAYSDRRLKTDVQTIQDPLQKVQELNGITYKRIDSGEVSTGLIAQDVQAVLPEAVTEDINGILAVKYGNLAGLFVEAIKALNKEVAELRAEIKALKDAQ
jgi:hypothetical protein